MTLKGYYLVFDLLLNCLGTLSFVVIVSDYPGWMRGVFAVLLAFSSVMLTVHLQRTSK